MKTLTASRPGLESGATFSDCEVYRYDLWRRWGPRPVAMIFIGLNPSTATHTDDDPTIRRCITFAKREGCDLYVMLNLFGLRSTDPAGLARAADPVGPENDAVIARWLGEYPDSAVAAWGCHPRAATRAHRVIALRRPNASLFWCLGRTKDGSPRHPLYVRGDTVLIPWQPPDVAGILARAAAQDQPAPIGTNSHGKR